MFASPIFFAHIARQQVADTPMRRDRLVDGHRPRGWQRLPSVNQLRRGWFGLVEDKTLWIGDHLARPPSPFTPTSPRTTRPLVHEVYSGSPYPLNLSLCIPLPRHDMLSRESFAIRVTCCPLQTSPQAAVEPSATSSAACAPFFAGESVCAVQISPCFLPKASPRSLAVGLIACKIRLGSFAGV